MVWMFGFKIWKNVLCGSLIFFIYPLFIRRSLWYNIGLSEKGGLEMTKDSASLFVPAGEQPYPVPENWRWTYIGNLVTVIRGVSYKKEDAHKIKQDHDVLILRGGNIAEGRIDTSADNVYVNASLVSEKQYVRKHDVIIVASTGSKSVIGRAGVSDSDYKDVSFGAFLMLVRPRESVNPRFIDFYFQSVDYRNRIRDLAVGVNINNIRSEYITGTVIPLPPLPEQRRIVDRIESLLFKLDEAREKAQAVVGLPGGQKATLCHVDRMKKAILGRAFRGLLGTNDPAEESAARLLEQLQKT